MQKLNENRAINKFFAPEFRNRLDCVVSFDRVIKALNGYKDGSYGGVMKNLMKTHVETKTPEQIEVFITLPIS